MTSTAAASTRTPGLVSVVVPTRNNERTIEACLSSVRNQSYPQVELIVVDNFSTDRTWEIGQELADLAIQAGPERSAQRNAGIQHSSGEWVLWLDSDMILPPQTLTVALEHARVIGSPAIALPERTIGTGYWTACRALERECYLDQPWLHNPRLIRAELLLGRGFDTRMSGPEDADLRERLREAGHTIELAPIIVDHDEGHLTISEVLQKRYYYGRSIPAFASAQPGVVPAQGRAILGAYRAHAKDLLADPRHAVGMVALRSLEVIGYGMGARAAAQAQRRFIP